MSLHARPLRFPTFVVIGIVVGFCALAWMADPFSLRGAPPEEPPLEDADCPDGGCGGEGGTTTYADIVVVFVIDSSTSMFPRVGPSYFDLARDGLIEFLDKPGLLYGVLKMAVFQFTELGAPGYDEYVHYLPLEMIDGETRDSYKTLLAELEPSTHHSAALMEMGIREAAGLLTASTGDADTQYHLVILSSGEYRLPFHDFNNDNRPDTCPHPDYAVLDTNDTVWQALACRPECRSEYEPWLDRECSRACAIRYQAEKARQAGFTVSTMRLGLDWRDDQHNGACEVSEGDHPYGVTPDYCQSPPPVVPDRDGFLKELANWGTLDVDGIRSPCNGGQNMGKNARIEPIMCLDCLSRGVKPGSPRIIADELAKWFCAWGYSSDQDNDQHKAICDNCPTTNNPHQRDCDRDRIGDACQESAAWCGSDAGDVDDDDGDGLCNGRDICPVGDDCLISEWLEKRGCEFLEECDCDCDNTNDPNVYDLCQAAWDVFDDTLTDCGNGGSPPCTVDEFEAHDANFDGLPDFCDEEGKCSGIPAACDAAAMRPSGDTSEVTELYFENFDTIAGGQFIIDASTMSNAAGWYLSSDPSTLGQVTVVNDPCILNGAPCPMADESGGVYGKVVELTVNEAQPTSWFLESPGLVLPETELTYNGSCNVYLHPGDWGVVSIKVDLFLDNDDNARNDVYDLYIADPCLGDFEQAKRVHIQFRNEVNEQTKGAVYVETYAPASASCNEVVDENNLRFIGKYNQAQWMQLHVRINTGQQYWFDSNGTLLWTGQGNTVRVYWNQDPFSLPNGLCTNSNQAESELGLLMPNYDRGVQLRISGPNLPGANPIRIGQVGIWRTTLCEWKTGDACNEDQGQACVCDRHFGSVYWRCEVPANASPDPPPPPPEIPPEDPPE